MDSRRKHQESMQRGRQHGLQARKGLQPAAPPAKVQKVGTAKPNAFTPQHRYAIRHPLATAGNDDASHKSGRSPCPAHQPRLFRERSL